MTEDADEIEEETGDPEVPGDLLDLHVELEDKSITPDKFKEAFGS